MTQLRYQWNRLQDFTAVDWHCVMLARQEVFVAEQRLCCPDADQHDFHAWHLVAWDKQQVAACLRLLDAGVKYPEPAIGRLLTLPAYRRNGLGRQLMQMAMTRSACLYPGQPVCISAQCHLLHFYEQMGFAVCSGVYTEGGIPHQQMQWMPA